MNGTHIQKLMVESYTVNVQLLEANGAMPCINEIELANAADDLMTSQCITGPSTSILDTQKARIATALKKIIKPEFQEESPLGRARRLKRRTCSLLAGRWLT